MKNYKYEYKGLSLTQYCKQNGICYHSAYRRIIDGLSIEDAIRYAIQAKNNYSHRSSIINGMSTIEYFETNYKHPITAYLRYSKLKSQGYEMNEILKRLEKYKD